MTKREWTRHQLEKDRERMRAQHVSGKRVVVLKHWLGVEQWLKDELGLIANEDVFVPKVGASSDAIRIARARFNGRLRYREQRDALPGLPVRPRTPRDGLVNVDAQLLESMREHERTVDRSRLVDIASTVNYAFLEDNRPSDADGTRFHGIEIDWSKITEID